MKMKKMMIISMKILKTMRITWMTQITEKEIEETEVSLLRIDQVIILKSRILPMLINERGLMVKCRRNLQAIRKSLDR
jgi:hypothetical protein